MTIKYQAMHTNPESRGLIDNGDSRIGAPQPTKQQAHEIIELQALRMYPGRARLQQLHIDRCWIKEVDVADVPSQEDA